MKNLPNEIIHIIMSYLYKCGKDKNYILDKETFDIYKYISRDCNKIFILRKNLCERCEKYKIIRLRMIMNNLLPG